jgi:chloramphenicol 3-O phosphotransferase
MKVIYLNGASCSGKSSLVRELQAQLPGYYLHIGIDTFIHMMPAKSNRWESPESCDGFTWKEVELPDGESGMEVQSGHYGKKVNDAFHTTVLALLQSGHNLIIDDVADGINEVGIWLEELAQQDLVTVGVYCSIEELRRRELARGDRKIGSAAEQYYRVHQGVDYDFTVNTESQTPEQCAQKIVAHITSRAANCGKPQFAAHLEP